MKTSCPIDDYRKALSLIDRVTKIAEERGDEMIEICSFIETVVGKVVLAKMRKLAQVESAAVADPIVTAWGRVSP